MSERPKLSVIVPSFNRRDEIQALLESLAKQDAPPSEFKVIVVDDGSTDDTEAWVKSFQQSSNLQVRYLQQDHQGPGAARNNGMAHAEGDVFVFIDSDCTAPPNWISVIQNAFVENPELRAFGGRDDAREDFPPLLLAINYSMTSFLTTGGMRGGKKKRLAKFYPRSFNMGLHRRLYEKIGGFGSLRHGQDIEYSNRIIKSGDKVAYLVDSVVYHKRRTSVTKFFRQVFNWGVARINLYKIDSSMLEPLHFAPAIAFWIVLLFTLAAIFSPAIFSVWKWFALLGILALIFSAIDAMIRYKNVRAGLWVPLVMIMQVSGYGLGFTFAFIRRVILNKGEFTGFVKRYY